MSYTTYSLVCLALAGAPVTLLAVRRRTTRRWWAATGGTAAILLVLTVVFDSLMVAAGLFHYDAARALGVDAWLTPVEDLAWPVAAALLVPALWRLTGRRDRPVVRDTARR